MAGKGNVVNLFDVAPQGGAVDPNDPILVAQGGTLIKAGSPVGLVKRLQLLLASWGFSPGNADGTYGTNTATAVRGVQAKLDLDQDGVFGPDTANAIAADLAKGAESILRANKAMFTQPLLPPRTGAPAPRPAAQPGGPLPATQPAVSTGVPWWVWLGGAAAVVFLISRTRTLEDTPLAPPGSVVADLGDEDDFVIEEEVAEEEPAPKPKKKRKPRKKKAVSEVKTPDEVLPPSDDNVVDVEFTEV